VTTLSEICAAVNVKGGVLEHSQRQMLVTSAGYLRSLAQTFQKYWGWKTKILGEMGDNNW